MINVDDFQPAWGLRHPQLQSVLATKSPRRKKWLRNGSRMEAVAQAHVLDAGNGVRLNGYHSAQSERRSRGLVVLIHGWEGSHESTYLYSMACALFAAGYDIFRLNLRDHGGTHHLNREVFHSARIDEVIGAVSAARSLSLDGPLFVIGFSLGGNFSLRVGIHGPERGLHPDLSIGVCPSINPRATIAAIDSGSALFRWYFRDKWRKTVNAKIAAWPEYAASAQAYLQAGSLLEITARFAEEQTEYGALEPYFAAYTLTPDRITQAASPLAIITAADDPVIPIVDFKDLRSAGALRSLDITAHGGHCGFIENLGLASWAERRVMALLEQASG